MQIYRYPPKESWNELTVRATTDYSDKLPIVEEVMQNIRLRGDVAVKEYTAKYDRAVIEQLQVSEQEILLAETEIDPSLAKAIRTAAENIRTFHESQKLTVKVVETYPGVRCWQKNLPVESVGLYIPGGTAPLFSTVLMLAVPAQIAGCREVILCTPPDSSGKIHPAILFAAGLCKVSKVFRIGGIQAIGAMAYGTESVPKVHKIFGPGNSWVTAAKQFASLNTCSIDMPAGPSELAVVADDSANPAFVASDLLSQAEHGADSQVMLITTDESMIAKVLSEINIQLERLPRKEIAAAALAHSRMILLKSMEETIKFSNLYAPEHLILQADNAGILAEKITNAGSVFIGHWTPESAGDYASGTNHTLPTNGWARSVSGLNLDSFCKKITYQEISREGLQQLGPVIETMAEAEMLQAHKNAVTLRISKDQVSLVLGNRMKFDLQNIIRKNIKAQHPYSSARDEFTGAASVFLDANENPYNEPYNRYPDPHQVALKNQLGSLKNIPANQIFLGNGSDEPIDLLFRAFCEPGIENVVAIAPTYGMYRVAADTNNITFREVLLEEDFSLNAQKILAATDSSTKMIFLCSPNNPTGNALDEKQILKIIENFNGLVVLDEAYIDFCPEKTLLTSLSKYPNLVILQTLSKAWGLAGIRLGMAFASAEIIEILSKIKYPYNINLLTQHKALEMLQSAKQKDKWVEIILRQKAILLNELSKLLIVTKIYPSDANFVLVKTTAAKKIYDALVDRQIIVRDRSRIVLCGEALRISVGTENENNILIKALKEITIV